ncbi:MAG: restriction endonuclease subunit S [Parabacteroides sp.]|nr:restriction endonuclease subunit S [Parabacteroides sp.]
MGSRKVKLGDFLIRSKIPIEIEDHCLYKRVTIRTKHQGVSVRDFEIGSKIGTKKQFVLKAGQFVLSKIDAMYGAFGVAPDEVDDAIITGNFWAYDYDKNMVSIEWLNHFTNSPDFYDLCRRASTGITHRKYLDEDFFLNYEVNLPDLNEQKTIVKSIDEIRVKVSLLENELSHQLTLLENLNQAILQEAVQGKLVPQDPKDEPASELLKRIKADKAKSGKKEKPLPTIKPEEIPFEIPENWVWCRLGEIIQYTENLDIQKYLSPDTIVNYVDIDAIDNQNFIIREAKQKSVRELSTRARRVLKPNFIAYSTVRPYLKNIAIVEDEKDNYIGSTGFNVFKTLDVELKYAFYYLLTPYVNNSFKDLMVGFNSPSITNDQFEKSLFPLPPLSEQKRIVAEIEKQLAKTKQLKEHIIANQQATEQLLKALLHQAFEVKEMEII